MIGLPTALVFWHPHQGDGLFCVACGAAWDRAIHSLPYARTRGCHWPLAAAEVKS